MHVMQLLSAEVDSALQRCAGDSNIQDQRVSAKSYPPTTLGRAIYESGLPHGTAKALFQRLQVRTLRCKGV